MKVADCLRLDQVKKIGNLDLPSATLLHRKIIMGKGFLKRLYVDWYAEFEQVARSSGPGALVELGSGGGFLKEIVPGIITSDLLFLPGTDINFSAISMPFKNNSVKAFFMLDVLHHINDPLIFFQELTRCLPSGGKIVMIEPANTAWSRLIWKNFHHEDFNPQAEWKMEGNGPLTSANSALPWIIFFRDRVKFNRDFPALIINRISLHTPFRYLISGGLSIKQLLPTFTYGFINILEKGLQPFSGSLGMFMTIEIEKV
jgi:SAM-dependent methyltransferase